MSAPGSLATTEHELKTWPPYFEAVESGAKTFELRKDDRGFKVGDTLHLREWSEATREYTGRSLRRGISYILRLDDWGLRGGYVVLGFVLPCLTAPAAPVQKTPETAPSAWLTELTFRIDKAIAHVCDLAREGGKGWRMSVPERPDDSDTLIIDALEDAKRELLKHHPDARQPQAPAAPVQETLEERAIRRFADGVRANQGRAGACHVKPVPTGGVTPMSTPEGLCTKCSATQMCAEHKTPKKSKRKGSIR